MTNDQLNSDSYWKDRLEPFEYEVLRNKATERPFSGKYVDHHANGTYTCKACASLLFSSQSKFESGSGWPSFTQAYKSNAVKTLEDTSHNMNRTEVICAKCGGHLGHVFPDGPKEQGGLRYCINSTSLDFTPLKEEKND